MREDFRRRASSRDPDGIERALRQRRRERAFKFGSDSSRLFSFAGATERLATVFALGRQGHDIRLNSRRRLLRTLRRTVVAAARISNAFLLRRGAFSTPHASSFWVKENPVVRVHDLSLVEDTDCSLGPRACPCQRVARNVALRFSPKRCRLPPGW